MNSGPDAKSSLNLGADDTMGLALSGGGFRATLFHLGLIRALYRSDALSRVGEIASVSGGSVIAAHLALHWRKYNGTSDQFAVVADELIRLVQADVRGRLLRRIPIAALASFTGNVLGRVARVLGWQRAEERLNLCQDWLTPTGILARYYDLFLFKKLPLARIGPTGRTDEARPRLHMRATNAVHGKACDFTDDGFRFESMDPHPLVSGRQLRISEAVSASSAFPGFFPPMALRRRRFLWGVTRDVQLERLYVTDGGVYDNLGVTHFQRYLAALAPDLSPTPPSVVIVSDATNDIDWETQRRTGRVFGAATRAIDIIMIRLRNVSKASLDDATRDRADAAGSAPNFVFANLSDVVEAKESMPTQVQRNLRNIRTDFDCFSDTEVATLIEHGYSVGLATLTRCNIAASPESSPWGDGWQRPANAIPVRRENTLLQHVRRGSTRKIGLFSWRDPVSYANVAVIVFLVLQLVGARAPAQTIDSAQLMLASLLPVQPKLTRAHSSRGEIPKAPPKRNPGSTRIVLDSRTFDMRAWIPHVGKNKRQKSGVVLARLLRLKKVKNANWISFDFKTSGNDLFVHLVNDDLRHFVHDIDKASYVGRQQLKTRRLFVNVEKFEVGEVFSLSMSATYWEAFQDEYEQMWAGALVESVTDEAALAVLFSDRMAVGTVTTAIARTVDSRESAVDATLVKDNETPHRFVQWRLSSPVTGSVYKIKWEFDLQPR